MALTTQGMRPRPGTPHPAGGAAPNRWYAVVANGPDEGTFVARVELLKGATMVADETCTHSHKTAEAARTCAKKMADAAGRLTL